MLYYPCSENKGADQLRGHREADLRLCFRICKKPVFSRRGSFDMMVTNDFETFAYMAVCTLYNQTNINTILLIFCLFGLRFYVPVNTFSVISGRSHRFLCSTSTFWEVNVSCSRIQHGDLSEDRTPDLSLRSPTLYH